jgi:hypothetical protein
MNWGKYKALCDQPDYWPAWMANQCIELLDGSGLVGASEVSAVLHRDLRRPALSRPAGHKGNEDTWMYRVSLSKAQCETLLETIRQAEQRGRRTSGTQTRGLGGFAEHCQELRRLRQGSVLSDQGHG